MSKTYVTLKSKNTIKKEIEEIDLDINILIKKDVSSWTWEEYIQELRNYGNNNNPSIYCLLHKLADIIEKEVI